MGPRVGVSAQEYSGSIDTTPLTNMSHFYTDAKPNKGSMILPTACDFRYHDLVVELKAQQFIHQYYHCNIIMPYLLIVSTINDCHAQSSKSEQ